MGGDKVPSPLDVWVELFEAVKRGEIRVGWNIDGMHIIRRKGGENA